MSWLYLLIAGIFEIGWPLGMKLSQTTQDKISWLVFSALSMALSGFFLWMAQKTISIGTAYAVWTGIGAIGAFAIGIFYFKDPVNTLRLVAATFIIIGIVGLKLAD